MTYAHVDFYPVLCIYENVIELYLIDTTHLLQVSYDWKFYVGCGPVFIAFFGVTILTHYESWDPVLLAFKKLMQCICRRRLIPGRCMCYKRQICLDNFNIFVFILHEL